LVTWAAAPASTLDREVGRPAIAAHRHWRHPRQVGAEVVERHRRRQHLVAARRRQRQRRGAIEAARRDHHRHPHRGQRRIVLDRAARGVAVAAGQLGVDDHDRRRRRAHRREQRVVVGDDLPGHPGPRQRRLGQVAEDLDGVGRATRTSSVKRACHPRGRGADHKQ
jgi:hypothetical protein